MPITSSILQLQPVNLQLWFTWLGIALTLATGAMRMASDNHWATDVHMGHLVGFSSGFLIPTLFFYTDAEDAQGTPDSSLLPSIGPDHLGLHWRGAL